MALYTNTKEDIISLNPNMILSSSIIILMPYNKKVRPEFIRNPYNLFGIRSIPNKFGTHFYQCSFNGFGKFKRFFGYYLEA